MYGEVEGKSHLSVLVLAESWPEGENENEAREASASQHKQPLDGRYFDDP